MRRLFSADVAQHIGLEDASPIQRAIITNDVAGFEKTKLRILNCAHSTLTYLGLLAGEESVEDAINNDALRGFVDSLISDESIPTIDALR